MKITDKINMDVSGLIKNGPITIVAFGDSMNDFQMIRAAHTGIAMGNACPELKEIADFVCESVQDDGIYHQFSRMGLIVQAD